MMTPTQTITFICGVVMCLIGVATFIAALLTRARKEGRLEYMVDEALRGIQEIKATLNRTQSWKEDMSIKIQSHTEQITTLFKNYETLDERVTKIEQKGN